MARIRKKLASVEDINIADTIGSIRHQLHEDSTISPTLRATIELLILIVTLLCNRLGLNSDNSSKPPSSDSFAKAPVGKKGSRKPGGQPGHPGHQLEPVEDPDHVEILRVDRQTLPKGEYQQQGFESRQIIDIDISRVVTEYQAQVLVNIETGERFVAKFPDSAKRPVQYGPLIKAHAVYLSQFQLLPYERVCDYFRDQLGIAISAGSIDCFNTEAGQQLLDLGADDHIRQKLLDAPVAHADETGINIAGQRHWLHCVSTSQWTQYSAHQKRGTEAMLAAGILPLYQGILCHDHWKPYFSYPNMSHALCNAHHLRELERAWEQDHYAWAKQLKALLVKMNDEVNASTHQLSKSKAQQLRQQYWDILNQGEIECPPPDPEEGNKPKPGRRKRSKSRNLLERLILFEKETLRFLDSPEVPFTNNLAERDVRMVKLQQKISGCFRSMNGAERFCRIRSYLSTCRKQGVSASEALSCLFERKLPPIFTN